MEALLIVDLQYDFLPGGRLAVPGGDEVIEEINRRQHDFPLVCATQDWHPPGHISFVSSHPGAELFSTISHRGGEQTLWPEHCVAGSRGAQLTEALDSVAIEAIFRKGMDLDIDSYSAFFDNGHRKDTGLSAYLHGRGVDHLVVCGLAADYCVYYTLLDALNEGFNVSVIEEAVRAIDEESWLALRNQLVLRGMRVL